MKRNDIKINNISIRKNITGKEFERLIAIKPIGKSKYKETLWLCKCKCGNLKITTLKLLNSKQTKSCGCLQKEIIAQINKKRKKHGMSNHSFYIIWKSLKERCNTPSQKSYKNYGSRGITYDSKWEKFEEFKKDMWYKYTKAILCKGLKRPSIERVDVNGNYNKENCIFIEIEHQNKNRQNNKLFKVISPIGKIYFSKNQREFARNYNLTQGYIHNCLYGKINNTKGWRFNYVKENFIN